MSIYREVKERVQSFIPSWNRAHYAEAALLAEAGFYAENNNQTVKCSVCFNTVPFIQEATDTLLDHLRLFPLCPLSRQVIQLGDTNFPLSNNGVIPSISSEAKTYKCFIELIGTVYLPLLKTTLSAMMFPLAETTIIYLDHDFLAQ